MPVNDGQKEWAWSEAARRSIALGKTYAIYRIQLGEHAGTDHIIRPITDAAPDPNRWLHIATIENGQQTWELQAEPEPTIEQLHQALKEEP